MILYGVGEWGRWGYLLVLLCFPVTLFASLYAYDVLFPDGGKALGAVVITGVAVFLALARVRAFYARRAKDQTQIQSDDHDAVS